MLMQKIKQIDNWFNSLTNGGRGVVLTGICILLILFVVFVGWVKDGASDYIEAVNYSISVEELRLNRLEANQFKVSIRTYRDELKKGRERGFQNFTDYFESKKLGELSADEYFLAKRLGRNKEQWMQDKQNMASTGRSLVEYGTFIENEIKVKKEIERIEAENKKRWTSEAIACDVSVDSSLRDMGYVFKWDDLSWYQLKFDAFDMNGGGDYGRYTTNKVAFQNRMGGYVRQIIECQVSRGAGSVSFHIR